MEKMTPNTNQAPTPKSNHIITRRIGNTTYRVAVHLSKTSKETMSDKITRMIKNEALGKVV
jgi:hypothetical protein